jgi:hypothetical protein
VLLPNTAVLAGWPLYASMASMMPANSHEAPFLKNTAPPESPTAACASVESAGKSSNVVRNV